MAFAVGAFVGLVSGLAFGGEPDLSTPKAAADTTESSSDVSTGSPDESVAPSGPMTSDRAQAIGANEMGQVLVIMYHLFDSEETEWTRTPENFRKDIALLKKEGFYPVNVRDLVSGNIDIPAGKSPVVLTFDDSSPGQYRVLENGSIDPNSAVGIMQAAVDAGGSASPGSFYCLLDVVPKERVIFGQEDRQQEKLRNLVDWGYEVGSHTVTHLNLAKASTQEATKQLAQSQSILENLIGGGYEVTSIALPFGEYPESDSILKNGRYEDITYAYTAGLSIKEAHCPSPFSTKFKPLHIPRFRGSDPHLAQAIKHFKDNPGLRYISDGDPTTVSAPAELPEALGQLSDALGRPVVRY